MKYKDIYNKTKIEGKNIIVTYPGRYHPYHRNHNNAYQELIKKFGDNVYINTSGKVEPGKSPFSFDEKKNIMKTMFNIDGDKIVQVKNPYNPVELLEKQPDDTVWIVGVGEKDSERLAGRKYFENIETAKSLKPYKEKGYYYIIPLQLEKFKGEMISGTSVRNVFSGDNEQDKKDLFMHLYGKMNKEIYDLIVRKISGVNESYDFADEYLIEGSIGD